jgi:hypothetical protein
MRPVSRRFVTEIAKPVLWSRVIFYAAPAPGQILDSAPALKISFNVAHQGRAGAAFRYGSGSGLSTLHKTFFDRAFLAANRNWVYFLACLLLTERHKKVRFAELAVRGCTQKYSLYTKKEFIQNSGFSTRIKIQTRKMLKSVPALFKNTFRF